MINQPHLLLNMKGPPKFEVGLRPIAIENWLFPDDQSQWLVEKNQLLNNEISQVYVSHEDSMAAQYELANLVAKSANKNIDINEPPLIAASRLVSDDLIIMEKKDGAWFLSAATLCSPTFFSAKFAYGKSLEILHGPIPTGNFDLSGRIARVFDNLNSDTVLERFNWTVQWSNERYTPDGSLLREMAQNADLSIAKNMLFERVERQTIRVLPQTRAIVFTIRIRINNLWNIIKERNEFLAFQNAWENAPKEVRQYKKWAPLERHVDFLINEANSQFFE